MNKALTIALALAAGFGGGLLTRYLAPPVAFAQNQTPVATEIRAQSFVLVDSSDRAVGTFAYDGVTGEPLMLRMHQPIPQPTRIVLRDFSGKEIWSAGGGVIQKLGAR
jgi:hypothetical protein